MNRHMRKRFRPLHGFTLIEVLVAVTLTLVMMAAVVQIFAIVGKSINDSRSTLEMSEQIRAAANRLRLDLEGVTADMTPPGRPEEGKGYFEYVEGPIGADPTITPGDNTDEPNAAFASGFSPDSTVGDRDDILQFTTRSRAEPFVGRGLVISDLGTGEQSFGSFDRYTTVVKSQVAEVAWFLRGTTLYRRVLLVTPSFDADIRNLNPPSPPREAEVPFKAVYVQSLGSDARQQMGYYNNYDLSVHWDPNAKGGTGGIVCNTLADLTRRECRYAHPPLYHNGTGLTDAFPYALHLVGMFGDWRYLGLPTLQECSHAAWPFPINGRMPYRLDNSTAVVLNPSGILFDAWVNPYTFDEIDPDTGAISFKPPAVLPYDPPRPAGAPQFPLAADAPRYVGPRVGEDVILTNVLSFDVKAWDPRAPVLLVNDGATPPNYNSLLPGDLAYATELATGTATFASEGAYVDLGYSTANPNLSDFSGWPDSGSQLTGLRIYDTWSIHYEHDGVNQDNDFVLNPDGSATTTPLTDEGNDGFDNDVSGQSGYGVVDDPGEREAPPPYDVPLRGIQIKIRVFEPDSQKVREVTIRHDFLKK